MKDFIKILSTSIALVTIELLAILLLVWLLVSISMILGPFLFIIIIIILISTIISIIEYYKNKKQVKCNKRY